MNKLNSTILSSALALCGATTAVAQTFTVDIETLVNTGNYTDSVSGINVGLLVSHSPGSNNQNNGTTQHFNSGLNVAPEAFGGVATISFTFSQAVDVDFGLLAYSFGSTIDHINAYNFTTSPVSVIADPSTPTDADLWTGSLLHAGSIDPVTSSPYPMYSGSFRQENPLAFSWVGLNGLSFDARNVGNHNTGKQVRLTSFEVTPVPEPTSISLLGLTSIFLMLRKKRS